MQLVETLLFWIGVMLYALSFGSFAVAMIFRKERMSVRALSICKLGLVFHTAALVVRWYENGYPPFVGFYESISAASWFAVVAYLILQTTRPGLRTAGAGISGAVFLLLGWASTPSYAGEALSASLHSIWLFIHATFATAAVGCFLVAAAISITWLWKRNRNGLLEKTFALESPEVMDATGFRYIAVGFLFYTVMLVSGAIWANEAWGRYWGWDPIETWSLITWLVYAVYLHLHFTFKKLRGTFTIWYSIIAVIFAGFSLWGVGFAYSTIHTYG